MQRAHRDNFITEIADTVPKILDHVTQRVQSDGHNDNIGEVISLLTRYCEIYHLSVTGSAILRLNETPSTCATVNPATFFIIFARKKTHESG